MTTNSLRRMFRSVSSDLLLQKRRSLTCCNNSVCPSLSIHTVADKHTRNSWSSRWWHHDNRDCYGWWGGCRGQEILHCQKFRRIPAVIWIIFCTFAHEYSMLNTYLFMARPIKETPILYGEDARRFEARMQERRRISMEERTRINAAYEAVKSVCDFM